MKFLILVIVGLLIGGSAMAEDPSALLSKDSARSMFITSKPAWEENARQIKKAGAGSFEITPAGEYTLLMLPTLIGRGISLKPMDGASIEEVLDEINDMVATLARHIADRG
jgi:hypothetical protein